MKGDLVDGLQGIVDDDRSVENVSKEIECILKQWEDKENVLDMKKAVDLYNVARERKEEGGNEDKAISGIGRAIACRSFMYWGITFDVLRSWGRTGIYICSLMEESGFQLQDHGHLTMKKLKEIYQDCFSNAKQVWKNLGIPRLIMKSGIQLDEILQDVWHILVKMLMKAEDEGQIEEMLIILREISDYWPIYRKEFYSTLLTLVKTNKGYATAVIQRAFQKAAIDTVDAILEDPNANLSEKEISLFRKNRSYLYLELARSHYQEKQFEAALIVLGSFNDPENEGHLHLKIKLLLKSDQLEEGIDVLKHLMQLKNYDFALDATRSISIRLGFDQRAKNLYVDLQDNYPAKNVEIDLDWVNELVRSNRQDLETAAHCAATELTDRLLQMSTDSVANHGMPLAYDTYVQIAQDQLQASNYEECMFWLSLAQRLVSDPESLSKLKRIMSEASLKCEKVEEAQSLAREAWQLDHSKRSLLASFSASLPDSNTVKESDNIASILDDLIKCADFTLEDLAFFGRTAHNAQHIHGTLQVLELLIHCLHESIQQGKIPKICFGMAVQNAAQLRKSHNIEEAVIMKYIKMVLEATVIASKSNVITLLGPIETFRWIHGVSQNMAQQNKNADDFVLSSQLASKAATLYPEFEDYFAVKCRNNLFSALILQGRNLYSMPVNDVVLFLSRVKECLTLIQAHPNIIDGDVLFLHRARLLAHIRIGDPQLKNAIQQEMSSTLFSDTDFALCGGFASRSVENAPNRETSILLKQAAVDCFKKSLQLRLRLDPIPVADVAENLQQLIRLGEAREDASPWFNHVVEMHTKMGLHLSQGHSEWFIGKAWNLCVHCTRSHEMEQAKVFANYAMKLLNLYPILMKTKFPLLHEHYQKMLDHIGFLNPDEEIY